MHKKYFKLVKVASVPLGILFLLLSIQIVLAATNFRNGYYTKICGFSNDGSGGNGNISGFDSGVYNANGGCQASCSLDSGTCWSRSGTGNSTVMYWCDGRQTNCVEHESDWSTSKTFGNACGRTYQIDSFNHQCRNNWWETWTCGIPEGFIVWYSGDCSPPPPTNVSCNTNDITLSVSPNPQNIRGNMTFSISGDASLWISDSRPGVSNCSGAWNNTTCRADIGGTYTWTHYWKVCSGSFDNCSPQCSKSTTYSINSPTPTPTPTPTQTPTPPPAWIRTSGGDVHSNQ